MIGFDLLYLALLVPLSGSVLQECSGGFEWKTVSPLQADESGKPLGRLGLRQSCKSFYLRCEETKGIATIMHVSHVRCHRGKAMLVIWNDVLQLRGVHGSTAFRIESETSSLEDTNRPALPYSSYTSTWCSEDELDRETDDKIEHCGGGYITR